LDWLTTPRVAAHDCPGQHIELRGRVLDADSKPVNDALVEIWQADCRGVYAHPEDPQLAPMAPSFRGFGRVPTDEAGRFAFHTVKPGPVADQSGGKQAPHILVSIFMRGLLKHVVSRIYFPDEPLNARDAVLALVPAERQATLVARQVADGMFEWDVHLQGPNETVFFDC